MKIWKKLFIVLIVVIVIIAIGFGIYYLNCKKKASIIRDLAKKQEQTLQKDTYYQKITNINDDAKIIIEHYQKGEKNITFYTNIINGSNEIVKFITYTNNGETKSFIETGKENMAEKFEGTMFTMIPVNLGFKNSSDKDIIDAMKELNISIESTTYNGKDCYIYKAKNIPETYFDKETGLVLKYSNENSVSEYDFKFDAIDDKIFEPDLSGYTLKE